MIYLIIYHIPSWSYLVKSGSGISQGFVRPNGYMCINILILSDVMCMYTSMSMHFGHEGVLPYHQMANT